MPAPEFLSGQKPPSESLEALAIRGTYTPTLTATSTDPGLGTFGSISGDYYVTGQLVIVQIAMAFGTSGSSSGSGFYRISLPPGLPMDASWPQQAPLGAARLRDDSTLNRAIGWFATVIGSETDRVEIVTDPSVGNVNRVANNSPWTWANNDSLRGVFSYLTDA